MKYISKVQQKWFVFSIWFLLILLILPGCIGAKESLTENSKKNVNLPALEKYFEASMKAWKVPGIAVAIVKDGKIVLAKGYGVKEFSKKEKVDENTLFAIASNTKAFTAASLAILVDEGKITWDDKVREYLPYFKLYNPYVTEEMTIRDLLCHRSGLKTFSGDLLWYETSYSAEEVIKRAAYLKPSYSFRAGYGYSNIMFMAAGEVVAAVTGNSWKKFMKERILRPLGMEMTNIGTGDLKKYSNVATPHYVYPDGKTVIVPYTPSDNLGGAASINSNAAEMIRWIKMLLNSGKINKKQILSNKSIWEMWSSQNAFKVSPRNMKLFPSTHFRSYGLGWGLSDYKGHKIVAHGGALDGMISQVALVPELNLGLVVLTNSINRLPTALMYKIIDTYLGVPAKDWSRIYLESYRKREQEDLKQVVELPENKTNNKEGNINLRDYSGQYHCPMYGNAKVSIQKDKLVLNLLPAPIFISDLTHMYYDIFQLKFRNTFSFVPHGTGTVQFIRDKDGNVARMKIDVPNHDFWFDELDFHKIELDENSK